MSRFVSILVVLDALGVIALVIYVMRRKQQAAHEIGPKRQDRGLRELKPFQRPEVVDRKVKKMFSEAEREDVVRLLNSDLPTTPGLERLQLALLKLSDGNLLELRRLVGIVTSDPLRAEGNGARLIGLAEWPEAGRMGDEYVKLLPEEQEPIFQRDLKQYLRWVKH